MNRRDMMQTAAIPLGIFDFLTGEDEPEKAEQTDLDAVTNDVVALTTRLDQLAAEAWQTRLPVNIVTVGGNREEAVFEFSVPSATTVQVYQLQCSAPGGTQDNLYV